MIKRIKSSIGHHNKLHFRSLLKNSLAEKKKLVVVYWEKESQGENHRKTEKVESEGLTTSYIILYIST